MVKIRHISFSVPDREKSSAFYQRAFELGELGRSDSPLATGIYLSDGTMCRSLLRHKTDEVAGMDRGKDWLGVHHIGLWVDDLDGHADLFDCRLRKAPLAATVRGRPYRRESD
jgi:methylmalonyl-CoA/ethylmalonyl-CoA epimerase